MRNSTILPVAILMTLFGLLANTWLSRQSPVTPASAPITAFSGERAMTLLKELLAENVAHPIGSRENQRIKRRIQSWLDLHGISHTLQATWACSARRSNCAYVENIIATLPGEVSGPYLALMAHYDSVPNSPGAGDDMAGVVAVLETARAIVAAGKTRHPILLLITDGEEQGMLGAEAFFQQHALAGEVGVLFNVEGSGTRGRSQVLRTSMTNAWYMKLFAASAKQPSGTSLANEIFKRMPNDTDFSVSMAANIPGIDFAFAGERNHYHTANDNVANLDPRTVQHHGENLFPLAKTLANEETWGETTSSVVYNSSFGVWFQWPQRVSWVLLCIVPLLLLHWCRRTAVPLGRLLLSSTAVPLALLFTGGVLVHACFYALERINGTIVAWPAHLWSFRSIIFASLFLPALCLAPRLARYLSMETMLAGALWFLWLLSLLLGIFLPDAAPALLVVLLPAAILLAVAACLPLSVGARGFVAVMTLVFASLFLSAAMLLEETQGFRVLAAIWPWVGLFVLTAIAFARGPWVRVATTGTALALVVSFWAAVLLPLYSELRPQHLTVRYLEKSHPGAIEDDGSAMLHVRTVGKLPGEMQAQANFEPKKEGVLPWDSSPLDYVADAKAARLPAPSLVIEKSERNGEGREVKLRLASHRDAWQLRLYLPRSVGDWQGDVYGAPIRGTVGSGQSDGFDVLRVFGVQGREVAVNLRFESAEPVTAWLVDYSRSLPPVAAGLMSSRPDTALAVHDGDAAIVYTKVEF